MLRLTSMGRPCPEPTDCMTTAAPGEMDSVFITLVHGAYIKSKLMDSVSQMLNF